MSTQLSFLLLLLVFGAAGAVWVASIYLSKTTDVLSTRLGLGQALGGLLLLAVVTNLPEAAITVSAALSGVALPVWQADRRQIKMWVISSGNAAALAQKQSYNFLYVKLQPNRSERLR